MSINADDPTFPGLHIRPAQGWLNDPNGVCLIDGRYHVFFQHNPNAPIHADVHWGHASSTDLLRWEEHPIALAPRPGGPDAAGCWSGCITDDAGVPTAVYTGVPTTAFAAGVVLARSDRTLLEWTADETPVVGPPTDPTISEVRDPFVFTVAGSRYAIQGAGKADGEPQILLWSCDDLTDWQPLEPLLTTGDPIAASQAAAHIWECPNLFPATDIADGTARWVLLLSILVSVNGHHQLQGVRYLVGDLEPVGTGLRFVATSGGAVDDGPAFYAPQVLVTDDRVLLWGWAWERDRSPEQVAAAGWAGVLTYPRELGLDGGRLTSVPAAELDELRGEILPADAPIRATAFAVTTTEGVRLELTNSDSEPTLVAETAGPARVFVDGSLIETYRAGTVPVTTRAYPTADSTWRVSGPGALEVVRLRLP